MSRIMVVDDEIDIRVTLTKKLQNEGYEVITSESGEDCLDKLKAGERPDLILLDVMMPKIDGWETSRKIKTNPETKDIPISMLSVLSNFAEKKRSIEYGLANEHLSKTADFDTLLNAVEGLL
jgi:CheY-like chemotaxis protein